MSRKNSREEKKKRKLLKALRNTPPAYVDLIDYVRTRTRCTAGMAEKVCLSGAMMVDSHPIGYKWEKTASGTVKRLDRYVPADIARRIIIKDIPNES